MEPKDPIFWRVIGANVVAWIGAGIGALVGAFTGALFGGSIGWLIDRHIGDNRRDIYWDTGHRPD